MAITSTIYSAGGVQKFAAGDFKDSAASPAAMNVDCGFKPKYVKIVNETTFVVLEWFAGMTADHAWKTADTGAGVTDFSKLTSSGITVDDRGFTAVAPAQNDQLWWVAQG